MQKTLKLSKLDERSHTVMGVMTSEEPDCANEVFDYHGGGKAAVQKWSEDALRAAAPGQSPSMGNIRLQHNSSQIAGKATLIEYDDDLKTIRRRPRNHQFQRRFDYANITPIRRRG